MFMFSIRRRHARCELVTGVQTCVLPVFGNADAHAKNYSLLRRDNGQVVLAPLYDLVATHMWPELSAKLAMRFGRAPILEDVDRSEEHTSELQSLMASRMPSSA